MTRRHSGSGTRAPELAETAVRRAPTDLRKRPLDSFIFRFDELEATSSSRDLTARPSGWDTAGRQVLLAACRDDEEAKEYQGGGAARGPSPTSWARPCVPPAAALPTAPCSELADRLGRGQVQRQSPQLEATVAEDLHRPFLGGVIRPSPRYFVVRDQSGQWVIDAGRVHGIPDPTPDDTVEIALFAYGAAE